MPARGSGRSSVTCADGRNGACREDDHRRQHLVPQPVERDAAPHRPLPAEAERTSSPTGAACPAPRTGSTARASIPIRTSGSASSTATTSRRSCSTRPAAHRAALVTLQVVCGPEPGKLTPPHVTGRSNPGQFKTNTMRVPGAPDADRRRLPAHGLGRPQQGAPTGGDFATQSQMIGPNVWQVSGTAIGTFGGELTGIAYCRRSKKPLLTTVSAETTIPPRSFGTATTPTCPVGRSLVFTGFNTEPKRLDLLRRRPTLHEPEHLRIRLQPASLGELARLQTSRASDSARRAPVIARQETLATPLDRSSRCGRPRHPPRCGPDEANGGRRGAVRRGDDRRPGERARDRAARPAHASSATASALAGVNVTVAPGESLVVLGPNGSGKTHAAADPRRRCCARAAARRSVLGCALPKETHRLRGRVGYLGHEPLLYRDLTARENLGPRPPPCTG